MEQVDACPQQERQQVGFGQQGVEEVERMKERFRGAHWGPPKEGEATGFRFPKGVQELSASFSRSPRHSGCCAKA